MAGWVPGAVIAQTKRVDVASETVICTPQSSISDQPHIKPSINHLNCFNSNNFQYLHLPITWITIHCRSPSCLPHFSPLTFFFICELVSSIFYIFHLLVVELTSLSWLACHCFPHSILSNKSVHWRKLSIVLFIIINIIFTINISWKILENKTKNNT